MRLISLTTIAFIIILLASNVRAGELQPFVSDGCSAFPDGTKEHKELWLSCCYEHDLAYWRGGTRSQRRQADMALKSCVASVGKPKIASLMLAGVRVGGTAYLPTKFRWGYGWPYLRFYKALTPLEQKEVEEAEKQIPRKN